MRAEKVRKGGSVHGEGNSREGKSREGNSREGNSREENSREGRTGITWLPDQGRKARIKMFHRILKNLGEKRVIFFLNNLVILLVIVSMPWFK
jgi:hypothetical protein